MLAWHHRHQPRLIEYQVPRTMEPVDCTRDDAELKRSRNTWTSQVSTRVLFIKSAEFHYDPSPTILSRTLLPC